ncbi:MAG: acyltransferase [Bacteroidetes bacterium]|nr:acyltransferase [Bacteroidota bacterium]
MLRMKKYRFKKLTEDKGSWWIQKSRDYRLRCFRLYSGIFATITCYLKGIKKGNACEFYGLPYFQRYPHSTISMGDGCQFRSDQSSNLIGVNHKTIISTHRPGAKIEIGNNCGFSGTSIGAAREIIIGNNVLCGANVVITDFDWHENISKTGPEPVIIHDNVWLGLNCVVLKGVEIGENSIIGANSLVVKSIPANVIAGGNPCKVLREKE